MLKDGPETRLLIILAVDNINEPTNKPLPEIFTLLVGYLILFLTNLTLPLKSCDKFAW